MDGCDKDGLSTDAVHVDTGGSLDVVEMDVPKLGDHVDHIILGTDLKSEDTIRCMHLFNSVYLNLIA